MALSNVPSIFGKDTEEQVKRIQKYLISLKNELEYELENVNADRGQNEADLKGLMQLLGFSKEDIAEWNKIKKITDNLGNVIADKLKGSINTAITNILNTTATVVFDDNGIFIHDKPEEKDSSWAMRIGARGFMIAHGKIMHEDNETFEWDWKTFGTGEGFVADFITTGTLEAITLKACDFVATNITSGSIKGVNISACNLKSVNLESSTISATNITGGLIKGTTFEGVEFNGTVFNGVEMNTGTINASVFNTSTFKSGHIEASTFKAGTIESATINTSKLNACEIEAARITGTEIYGGTITGAIVQSLGKYGEGVMIKDLGYAIYAPGDIMAGIMMYDQNGAGTDEEAKDRVLFGTANDFSLKIHSDADMSITAKGEIFLGDCRFMGTTNLGMFLRSKIVWVEDGCIIDDQYYLKMTDTAITILNTNEKMTISTATGKIEALYAKKSVGGEDKDKDQ